LLTNVRKSSLGRSGLLRHDGAEDFFGDALFECDVTAFLPEKDEASPFQRANEALARNAALGPAM